MEAVNRTPTAISLRRRLTFDLASPHLVTLQIVVILIVAAILRLYQVDQPLTDVFSWRQVNTAMIADNFYRGGLNVFYPAVSWNGAGASYQGGDMQTVSYLAALLYVVFGQFDWVGRGLTALLGLWGIFALYQLVRRVWDEAHAIASAVVLALLPGAIFIDRSFLPDPAAVALMTTSLWMLALYFQEERPRYLVLACIAGALGLLTRLPAAVMLIPMVYLAFALSERESLTMSRQPFVLTIAALCMAAPALAYAAWSRQLTISHPPYHFLSPEIWVWDDSFAKWWGKGYFISDAFEIMYSWLWTAPVMGLLALGLLFGPSAARPGRARQGQQPADEGVRKAPWLFHWWLAGCGLLFAVGARGLTENPWNYHLFNPAVAALAGHALILIWSLRAPNSPARAALVRVAIILLIAFGVGQAALQGLYAPEHANQGYQMGLALREMTQPRELVVTLANDPRDPIALYYGQRHGWLFPPTDVIRGSNDLPEDDDDAIQMLDDLRARGAMWLAIVNDREDFWVEHPALLKYVKQTCEFKVKTDDYVVYRIKTQAELAHSQ
jgi:hypothetical protein